MNDDSCGRGELYTNATIIINFMPRSQDDKVVARRIAVATNLKVRSHASNGRGEDFPCRRGRLR